MNEPTDRIVTNATFETNQFLTGERARIIHEAMERERASRALKAVKNTELFLMYG